MANMRASRNYNVGYSSAHLLRFYCGDQFPSDKNKTMLPIKTHWEWENRIWAPLGAAVLLLMFALYRSRATIGSVEVLLYVHRNRRFIRDGSPGRPPRLSFTHIGRVVTYLIVCRHTCQPPLWRHWYCWIQKRQHQLTVVLFATLKHRSQTNGARNQAKNCYC